MKQKIDFTSGRGKSHTLFFSRVSCAIINRSKNKAQNSRIRIKNQSQLDGDMAIIHLIQSQIKLTLFISRMTNATGIS